MISIEMDVLSEVLKIVRLQGAFFYNGQFGAPWRVFSPASRAYLPYLTPDSGLVVIFHLITEGKATVRLVDGEPVSLEAGDLVVFPHGDPHIFENGTCANTVDMTEALDKIFSEDLKVTRIGGKG